MVKMIVWLCLMIPVLLVACEEAKVEETSIDIVQTNEHGISLRLVKEFEDLLWNQMTAIEDGDMEAFKNTYSDSVDRTYIESIRRIMEASPSIVVNEFDVLYQQGNEVLAYADAKLMTDDEEMNQRVKAYYVLEQIDGSWKFVRSYEEDLLNIKLNADGDPFGSSRDYDQTAQWEAEYSRLVDEQLRPSEWIDAVRRM